MSYISNLKNVERERATTVKESYRFAGVYGREVKRFNVSDRGTDRGGDDNVRVRRGS